MTDLTLYHASPSRSSIALWMLEEVGQPFQIRLLDLKKGDNFAPDYLAINPMGKVPALRHGEVIVTETAAICCYLADAFPAARLAPPIGDKSRGPYLKWLFFSPGVVEPALTDRAFKRVEQPPRGALGYGDYDTAMNVLADAVRSGPFLLGRDFSAADVVVGSTLRWGMLFRLIEERQEFSNYVARLVERPAFQRAAARDEQMRAATSE